MNMPGARAENQNAMGRCEECGVPAEENESHQQNARAVLGADYCGANSENP